jgi:hypothetical protein
MKPIISSAILILMFCLAALAQTNKIQSDKIAVIN